MSGSLNILWWVGLALLFFWVMHRAGCGSMMGRDRGRAGRHAQHAPSGTPVDPVCGMEVDPAKAAGTRVADGETYFFCSQTCLDAFDRDAAMYAHHEQRAERRQHAGC